MPRRKTPHMPDILPILSDSGPDWRWKYAESLLDRGQHTSRPRDGDDVARLIEYCRAKRKGFCGRFQYVYDSHKSLVDADNLRRESFRFQMELHARVLANESVELIGLKLNASAETIADYEMAFFDVRTRLHARSFVLHRVIGLDLHQPPTAEQLFYISAMHQGPAVIDFWLDWFDHQAEPSDLSTPQGRMRERIDLLVTAKRLVIDSGTQLRLARLSAAIDECEKKMGAISTPNDILRASVHKTLFSSNRFLSKSDNLNSEKALKEQSNGIQSAPFAENAA